ncbi:uncharacterized protein UDID_19394 [Ustilago sp. UG-2017a]|nr:uncharacterized protein UDID_19394 [Ustilago sp. UG-2017a]
MATTSLLRRCAPYLLSSLLLVLQILATAATMTPSGIPEKLFPASLDPAWLPLHFYNRLGIRPYEHAIPKSPRSYRTFFQERSRLESKSHLPRRTPRFAQHSYGCIGVPPKHTADESFCAKKWLDET